MRPARPPSSRLDWRVLAATLPATLLAGAALDLTVAAALGYPLRTEIGLLLAAEAFLFAASLPVLALLYLVSRLPGVPAMPERAPGTFVLTAAWLPVALGQRQYLPYALQAAVLLALLLLAIAEARRPWRRLPAALAVTALAVLVLAVTVPASGRSELTAPRPAAAGAATAEKPNLLLIALDTLRADHLGIYGYPRPTSPWLDRYAAASTLFERAVSPSSYTLPPHATLFTGLYPRSHGAQVSDDPAAGVTLSQLGLQADHAAVQPLAPEAVTLAEIARTAGLETGAICANSAYLSRHFGLDQGFDTYVDTPAVRPEARPAGLSLAARLLPARGALARALAGNERYYLLAPEVNRLALDWLEARAERRFFLFLNYMDPHAPYLPVGAYRHLFRDGGAAGDELGNLDAGFDADAYDAEIRYLDDHLGRLFTRLEELGLLERTVVVLVADHGESFGEHGRRGHAVSVYEGEVRVPLLLRLPGQQRGERVEPPVPLVDVLPTLLEALRLPAPPGLEGGSLLAGGSASPIVTHLGRYERDYEEYAYYRDPWKLIVRGGESAELYDLRRDPGERVNLLSRHRAEAEGLRADLERFLAATGPRFAAPAQTVDPETLERLRALGYAD